METEQLLEEVLETRQLEGEVLQTRQLEEVVENETNENKQQPTETEQNNEPLEAGLLDGDVSNTSHFIQTSIFAASNYTKLLIRL